VSLLVVANTINIAADIAAMGEALQLLVGGPQHVYAVAFGGICLVLQVFMPYERYVGYLKWLTLSLLAYVATVFMVNVPWSQVVQRSLWPSVSWTADVITVIVAVFGTTISPYLFFWQAAQEVADLHAARQRSLYEMPETAASHLARIKVDTMIGMGFSNLVAFFIMLSTAATLHVNGVTNIETSAQAAEALRPIGGELTFLLFSLGIIGTGMLAVPVLAGSAAYAVTECFKWRRGLDLKLLQAREFYAIVALATAGGVALDFTPMDPIKGLFWSAVINGVIAVPIMAVMMLMAVKPAVMGPFAITRRLKVLGWLATAAMGAAVVAMFATWS
jgi:Mn2+/Fe2+ NRAMP family transporter